MGALPPELAEQLKELSKITRVPQAADFREAVEDNTWAALAGATPP
jgi:predicted DNA-binding protein